MIVFDVRRDLVPSLITTWPYEAPKEGLKGIQGEISTNPTTILNQIGSI